MSSVSLSYWWNRYAAIPYKDGGRSRSGCDCWGLVRLVYDDVFGITLFDEPSAGLSFRQQGIKLAEGKKTNGVFIELLPDDAPDDGDLVVLLVGGLACHVGVVCDRGQSFLHSIGRAGTVIERLDSLRWKDRIDSFWRVAVDS